ncbi:MAG TPA: hypothetical protein VFB43_17895 [Terracidiphilus sp.]|nr:hypothetical protein [Terracidiphilus sp.]
MYIAVVFNPNNKERYASAFVSPVREIAIGNALDLMEKRGKEYPGQKHQVFAGTLTAEVLPVRQFEERPIEGLLHSVPYVPPRKANEDED